MPIAAAVPAIIGAGSSIIGGIMGSSASNKAAQQQSAALQKGIDTTNAAVTAGQSGINTGVTNANELLSQAASLYSPFTGITGDTLTSLQQLAGANGPLTKQFSFNPTDLQNDPGYAFTLQQGQDAIQRAAAAKGNLFSSGTLKSLAGYTTGTANQYFNDAYNRALGTFQANQSQALNRIGTLQGLANLAYSGTGSTAGLVGQKASNTLQGAQTNAGIGLQGAGQISGMLSGQGNAQAAGTIGSANAWSNALAGGTNAINSFLTARNLQNSGGNPNSAGSLQGLAGYQTRAAQLNPFVYS